MPLILANNFATTTLASPLSTTSTTVALTTGTGTLFPNPTNGQYFALTLNDAATRSFYEIVYVTARSADTLTVVRAQDGTTALNWLAGDFALNNVTAGTFERQAQLLYYTGTDPNGSVAGVAATGIYGPTLCWAAGGNLWVCTATGPAASAVWVSFSPLTVLTSAKTYYVNPITGTDTPTSGGSAGTPWATIAYAYSWLQKNINANGQQITISCAHPDTPTPYSATTLSGGVTGVFTPSQVQIIGDITTQHCQISGSFANNGAVVVENGALLQITGFNLANSGSVGSGLVAQNGAQVNYGSMSFGVCSAYATAAAGSGTIMRAIIGSTNIFLGNCLSVWHAAQLALNGIDSSTATTGGITVGIASATGIDNAIVSAGNVTFDGSGVIGSRFQMALNSSLDTDGSQSTTTTNYLPGSTAGTTPTGGQFA